MASFRAKDIREVCVELPTEDDTPVLCVILKKSMYGTSDAAHNWEPCYRVAHLAMGFTQGERHRRVCYIIHRGMR